MFEGLPDEDREDTPFCFMDTNSFIQWMFATNIETWRDPIIETTETTWKEKYDRIKKHKDAI
jgi:hypothetical protein